MIIGISGKIGSGKTEVSKYVSGRYGLRYISTSEMLKSILIANGQSIKRENLQKVGGDLINAIGGRGFMCVLIQNLPNGDYVIDSIRHLEALRYMRERYKEEFILIYVEASSETRFSRKMGQFRDMEFFNKSEKESTEIEIESIRKLADYVIGTEEPISAVSMRINELVDGIMKQ